MEFSSVPPTTEHAWFLLAYDYEWEAIASIFTAFGVLVALGLPLWQRWRDNQRSEMAKAKRHDAALFIIRDALNCLAKFVGRINIGGFPGYFEAARTAAEAAALGETLRIMVSGGHLAEEAQVMCVQTAQAMDCITRAARSSHEQADELEAALTVATMVSDRIERLHPHATKAGRQVRAVDLPVLQLFPGHD